MSTREKVAKIICQTFVPNDNPDLWDDRDPAFKEIYLKAAEAVLAAMATPDEASTEMTHEANRR